MAGTRVDEPFSYIFTWETQHDERVCPKCFALNGREYTDQDLFAPTLTDPEYGSIWDLDADYSLAHGHQEYNCRCQIAVCIVIDWSKVPELYELSEGSLAMSMYQRAPGTSIAELRDDVKGLKGDIDNTKKAAAELNRLLTTYIALARRMGLPPEVIDLIARFQQARIMVQTLIHSIHLLEAATGPVGWALALGGIALSGFMATDLMYDSMRGS